MPQCISGFMPLLFGLLALAPSSSAFAQQLEVKQVGNNLDIVGQVPGSIHEVNLWIESSRNTTISKMSDISPLNPNPMEKGQKNEKRDVSYPIVDVRLEPGMVGVMKFPMVPKTCALNSLYFKDLLSCMSSTTVPANHLLFWENSLFIEPAAAAITGFYLEQGVPVVDGRFHFQVHLLSPDWSGNLSLHATDAEETELSRTSFSTRPVQLPTSPVSAPLSRDRLMWSLRATVSYILHSRDSNPLSPTYDGLNLFYDLDAKTYRSPYWVWGSGPEVSVLVAADKIPEVAAPYAAGELLTDADNIGKTSLGLVVVDPDNPALGISLSRWNRSLEYPLGFNEMIAPSDSNFLSRWAWLPLYQATGNVAYLNAAKTLAEATEKLVKTNELIPQEYKTDEHKWTETTILESAFGADGLSELYQVTKDVRYKQMTLDYIDQHIRKLQRKDGLWDHGWNAKTGTEPIVYKTRSMGWVMEGMLAANRAAPEGPYLSSAKQMADYMLKWQEADGSWVTFANEPRLKRGTDDKGTPLWSYLLYQLYKSTHDPRYLAAARKALEWCIRNQYAGPDPQAFGGLVGVTLQSAVGYREFFPMTCGYSSGFFGMAVVEELALQKEAVAKTDSRRGIP